MSNDFFVRRSSWRPVCFIFRSAGVYQGDELIKETVCVLRGARVLSVVHKAELSWLTRSSGEVRAESRWRVVESRSVR